LLRTDNGFVATVVFRDALKKREYNIHDIDFELMAGSSRRPEGMGLWSTIALAVGTMIGAGVFVLSELVIEVAGPAAILSYPICGVIIISPGLS
jgi:hypothetical protein